MATIKCPLNPEHNRFAACFVEQVDHELDANGQYVGDVRNTYGGDGYEGGIYCLDCSHDFVKTTAIYARSGEPILDANDVEDEDFDG